MSSNIEIKRICEFCKQAFTAKTTKTRYCSHKCNSKGYKANVKELKIEISNIETKKIIEIPIELIKTKPFLNIEESSQLLGISKRTLYRLIEKKEIKAHKIGSRTIIKRAEIDKLFI